MRKYKPKWFIDTLLRDEFKCTKCGSKRFILVHHKDESRKNGIKLMNNDLENLETLCKRCHAKAHGFTKYISLNLWSLGRSYEEIGSNLGISKQRVQQILSKINTGLTNP